jgi:Transposase IS66 family
MAHVRRKFIEAEAHYAGPCREVLDLIGQLYAVERAVPSLPAPGATDESRAEIQTLRSRLRAERSRPIVHAIQTWALAQRALPESSLGKDVGYMAGLWAVSRRPAHSARQQSHRAGPARRGRPQEPLRLPLAAPPGGGRALLQLDRVGEAERRRSEPLSNRRA